MNRITEPIENQTLDEVWECIRQRKEAKLDVTDILAGLNITRSYQEIVEEPKQRAAQKSSPVRVSAGIKLNASPSPSRLNQTKDWSFVADNVVLYQELDLGRDLLSKAV